MYLVVEKYDRAIEKIFSNIKKYVRLKLCRIEWKCELRRKEKQCEISDYYMIESICFFILMVTVPAYQPVLKFEHLYFKISIFTKEQKSHLPLFKFEMKKFNIILKLYKESHSLPGLFRMYINKRVALKKFSHMCNWKNVKEHHSNIT